MTAEELIHDGQLDSAYQQLKQQIQADPANPKLRIFLFQLLTVMGEWQRALTQLNVVGDMDSQSLPMVQTYRELIRCEVYRERVFQGKRKPLVFGEPEQWMMLLIEALSATDSVEDKQIEVIRQQAFELAPAISGQIDNNPFAWIADADSRLGPVLEVVLNGRYYWVPFTHIKTIEIESPTDLRDLVWTPAHFVWTNEGEMIGFIPSRYVSTHLSDESSLKLARKTIWQTQGDNTYIGKGQRLLTTDQDDYPLLNSQKITLELATTES